MKHYHQIIIHEVMDEIIENTYNIITQRKTIDQIMEEVPDPPFPIMFLIEPGSDTYPVDIYELLIDYYEEEEEYERCQELLLLKPKQ